MRYPEFLKENGTIGFVAPSFGCNIEPYQSSFNNALKKFKEMDYQIDLGPNCYEGKGIGISNSPYECGRELSDYYCSEANDVLLSCGGGELMCEILNYIDFEKIRNAPPKWYMGYSDNTNFTFLLTTLCDCASIYGPCAPAFGMEPWHAAIKDAFEVLKGKRLCVRGYDGYELESLKNEENPLAPYNITEARVQKIFYESSTEAMPDIATDENSMPDIAAGERSMPDNAANGRSVEMKGRLIGGCMDCLVNLIGTKFDKVEEFLERYKEDGFIWFLESCDLNVMSIRRAMWQMDNGGWFQYVKGFLIGRPLCHGQEMMGLDQYEAVLGIVRKYQVPVIMDVDIGHMAPMMPLICGAVADVKVSANDMDIKMELAF